MSVTQTYDFASGTDFIYDNDEIEFSGSFAKLKLLDNPGQDFTEDFADDTGFTYDNTKAEFTGGLVQQKDQRPANATFGTTYTTDINGNWGNGILTGTASGGASVSGGKLNLKGATLKYVTYDAIGNAPNTQIGCIKLKYTPNYSGSPAGNRYLFDWYSNPANDNNSLQIFHASDGTIKARLCNSIGNYIYSSFLAAWIPVSGTEYEFEFNFDFTAGATRLFINGVQIGSTITATGTRTSSLYLRIGAAHDSSNSDGEFNDIKVFSIVQHTANYTPGYTVAENIYLETSVICPEMEYTGAGTLVSFDNLITTETLTPKYTLQIARSENYLYWSGSAWVTSDGTYSQSTSKTDFNLHKASLPVIGQKYGQFKIHFESGSNLSSISELTASLTSQIYPTTNASIIPVTGINADDLESVISTFTATGFDTVKFVLNIDGIDKYYTGSAWAESSGFAQSNIIGQYTEGVLDLLGISLGAIVKPKVFLHSEDGLTTPTITRITEVYNFYAPSLDVINKCTVWGYIYKEDGTPSATAVTVKLTDDIVKYKTGTIIRNTGVTVTPNIEGYWEVDLIENENMAGSQGYQFIFSNTHIVSKKVPNTTDENFYDLETL
jgi:hypothetical protein